jgi:hypothetical protein
MAAKSTGDTWRSEIGKVGEAISQFFTGGDGWGGNPSTIHKGIDSIGDRLNNFFTGGDGWGGNPSTINKALMGGDGFGGELGMLEKIMQGLGVGAAAAGQGAAVGKGIQSALGLGGSSNGGVEPPAVGHLELPQLAPEFDAEPLADSGSDEVSQQAAQAGEAEEADRDEAERQNERSNTNG